MNIGRDCPQVVESLFITDVACAQNLLYFSRYKKLLEFEGKIVDPVGYVKVANDENKDHCVDVSGTEQLFQK